MKNCLYTLFICFALFLLGCSNPRDRESNGGNKTKTFTNVEYEKKDLILGFFAISSVILGIILLLKTRSKTADSDDLYLKLKSIDREYWNIKKDIDELKRVKNNYSVSIKDILRDEEFELIVYDYIEKYLERYPLKLQQEEHRPETNLIAPSESHKVLYGSNVRVNGFFVSMSEKPNDMTVYELNIKGETASVTIAKIAEAMIAQGVAY